MQGPSHSEDPHNGTSQIGQTSSSLINASETPANPAGQTDSSIAPSTPPPSETKHVGNKEASSWTGSSITVPVKTRPRRRSTKGNGKGSPSGKDKPPSALGSAEGKQSTKRRKISFFERITFICTSCVTSSPRIHDVDVEEGASTQKDKDSEKLSEKQSTKETETTTAAEHPTREPSASSTGERSSLGLASRSDLAVFSCPGSVPHDPCRAPRTRLRHSRRRACCRCTTNSLSAAPAAV
ncbi:uncharacterized protein PHACADRAFT_162558 [Phanerochaete carnosa HHB-10118-sp]|uniref:Uncharacterized protein n=1 Tax=Phanerochaete carnosa (strain HHB-10118-sp) TaxID=650164 RepID=K5W4W5_PHACS|nr:uncharacterized protein PHACADRAFT_162558 [Phanerochaete carnosa HHB-10118-sp]EKM54185.1 hypothetical protein PHACADRAFT_162558 [Phanerochaete carnosa HHB-10118-sp]